MPAHLETRQSIHKANKRPRSGPFDSLLVWRVVLAIYLCTCALTALYYEAAFGRGAIQGQMVFMPSSPRHTPCSYGVPEKLHQTFCCTGDFDCGDFEQKIISCRQVNDNYCDCMSGRDEPGTSACSQRGAVFVCTSTLQAISTSFVQDGFRDCMDGSDEASHTRSFGSRV